MNDLIMWVRRNYCVMILGLLVTIGLILRVCACWWGAPYQLHPDEGTIVKNAIDMISRGSYIAEVYNRPDHFEIKCCALLFQIVSYIKFHISADVAFAEHTMLFYLVARLYTVFWGTLTIFLAYKMTEKIKCDAKCLAAGFVSFFPVFVKNSAYATPDIVLTFFVLLIAYLSIFYLEKFENKFLIGICVATGIGITIKYTCAISCIWIAILVCIDCFKRRKYFEILKKGVFCIVIVLGVSFLIAPNLYINISETISILRFESRSMHLGSDGLGFLGNLSFYFNVFLENVGYEVFGFFVVGVAFCKKNKKAMSMLLGVLFLIFTSTLALHWERWGMPIYIFCAIISALGISYLYDLSVERKWLKYAVYIIGSLILMNLLLSSILVVQRKLTTEANVDAIQFCKENGITEKNTLYDGYTPFQLNYPGTILVKIKESGELDVDNNIEYLMISALMYERYYAEPERYQDIVNMYDSIQDNCELIYEAGGDYYEHSNFAIVNIVKAIQGLILHDENTITGYMIKIYEIS